MAKTLEQARQDRVRGQNEALQALFDLGKDVNNFPEPELSAAARQALSEGQLKAMRAREAEARAQDIFDQKREAFEAVEDRFQTDLEARRDELSEELFGDARQEDPAVLLQYAAATPDALRSVLEAAVVSGNMRALGQVILAAEARELDDVAGVVGDHIPEIGEKLAELSQVNSSLEDLGDPGDLFETLAPPQPTAEAILLR